MAQLVQTLPNIASVRDMQRNYKALFAAVKQSKKPLYLLSNNKPQVVVLDINFFENIIQKMRELEEQRVLDITEEGLTEYQKGETNVLKSLEDLI